MYYLIRLDTGDFLRNAYDTILYFTVESDAEKKAEHYIGNVIPIQRVDRRSLKSV